MRGLSMPMAALARYTTGSDPNREDPGAFTTVNARVG